jgi:hypothetical protein
MIKESPVNIECKVREAHKYGSHTMFTADVLAVHVDDAYMNENGKFCLENANPIVYSHGTYFTMGEELGTFGYSVKKAKKVTKEKTATVKTSESIGKERTKPRWKKSRKKK